MPSHDNADQDLIGRLRNRDPEGLAAAYDRYGQIVYSLFVRIVRDQSAAEDLVQELFIRLWNRSREFDPNRGTLEIWILTIARNMAIDHVRSAKARFATRLRPVEHIDYLAVAANTSQPESVIDRARTVRAAFNNLTLATQQSTV